MRHSAVERYTLAKPAVKVPDQLRTGIEVSTYIAIEMAFYMRNQVASTGKPVLYKMIIGLADTSNQTPFFITPKYTYRLPVAVPDATKKLSDIKSDFSIHL